MPVPNYITTQQFYQDLDPFVAEELAELMRNKPRITRVNTPAWFNSYLTQPSAGLVSRQDYTSRTALQNLLDENQERINKRLERRNTLLDPEKASGIASAVVGGIGLLGDAINEGRGDFGWDAYGQFNAGQERELSDYNNILGAANTTSDLLQVNDSAPDFVSNANNIKTKEFGFDGMLKGAGTGAALGTQIMPGIGTAIGAAAGFLTNGIGQAFGVFGDAKRQRQAQRDALAFDVRKSLGLMNAQNRVSTNTYRQGMANFLNNAAMGGPLSTHGSDFSDGLIRIDAGGTHEQNPLGGVPAGVDPNGIPNLVEEGETIWDNGDEEYVFSKRLKAPKSLVKKFALGGSKKGLTYSEAARKASSKSGAELRPNDPISKRTKDSILAELEDSQEEKRAAIKQREAIKALSEMSPEEFQATMMSSPMPQQEIEQPQMPPQEVVEEPVMQEPVQGGGMYEPVGVAAFGGPLPSLGYLGMIYDAFNEDNVNLFKNGGNKTLAQRYDEAIKSGALKFKDGYWSGTIEGPNGKGRQAVAGINDRRIKTLQFKAAYDNGATPEEATQAVLNSSTNQNSSRQLIKSATSNYSAKRASDNRVSPETKALYQSRNTKSINIQTPQRRENIGPYQDPTFDSRIEPNLKGLVGRSIVDLENPWYSYLVPNGDGNQIEFVKGTAAVATDQHGPFLPKSRAVSKAGSGNGSRRTSTPPTSILSTVNADVAADTDALADAILASTPTVEEAPINLGNDTFIVNKLPTTRNIGRSNILPTWMRYAPIVGGGLSVLSDLFSRPDYSGYESLIADSRRVSSPVSIPVETIGDRIRRNPFDERLMVNQANQNLAAGLRSTANNAGGNRAYRQFANNLMAYNNQNQLSDIARNDYLANRQDAFQTAEFSRGTDMYNTSAINQRNLTQAQLNANRQSQGYYARANALNALENARRYDDQMASADLTAFLTSLGNLGRENFDLNRLEAIRREGRYNIGYNGRTGDLFFSPTETYTVAKGGKVKTKKRRF